MDDAVLRPVIERDEIADGIQAKTAMSRTAKRCMHCRERVLAKSGDGGFEDNIGTMQSRQHRSARAGTLGLPQLWAGPGVAELGFESVKMLEVPQDPAGDLW